MSSSTIIPAPPASFAQPITEKLGRSNYTLWLVQVLPVVRGAQLLGYLDGSEVQPPEVVTEKVNTCIVLATSKKGNQSISDMLAR